MIKVTICKKNNNINKIVIKGHAKYDECGKDIVCAAVSSTVITTINAIEGIEKNIIEYTEHDGEIIITVLKTLDQNSVFNKLLINMIDMLKELEKDYTKYIKINEEV